MIEEFRSKLQKKMGWKRLVSTSRGFKYFINLGNEYITIRQLAPTFINIVVDDMVDNLIVSYIELSIRSNDRNFIKILMDIVTSYICEHNVDHFYRFMEEEESLDLNYINIIDSFYGGGFII